MSFVLSDDVFARIHKAKDKDARIASFAAAYEEDASTIRRQYEDKASKLKRGEDIQALRDGLAKYSIPKTCLLYTSPAHET